MSGLYIHVPFCRKKCPYCDFFSLEDAAAELAAYPDLLLQHLALTRQQRPTTPFQTVFFGGGTPSLLPPEQVGRLLTAMANWFGLASNAEISLEANPGTVSAETLAGYRAAGINRLSLGIQTLDAGSLQRLGRIHSPLQARSSVKMARQAGFENISCDLMFALPGQTQRTLGREIDQFLNLETDHLSCYGLSIEEGTPFYHLHRNELPLPEEEVFATLFRLLDERLSAAGFRHYEISNYARTGFACRHNLNYWQRREYQGIGAGAHSFHSRGWGERWAVPPSLVRYRAALESGQDPAEILEVLDRGEAMAETLFLGLRTVEGVDEDMFRARFGTGVEEAFPAAVRRAGHRLRLERGRWRLDLEGWLLYDYHLAPFLQPSRC
jgi:oxygen-independent coproporphyrinogen III oxidase